MKLVIFIFSILLIPQIFSQTIKIKTCEDLNKLAIHPTSEFTINSDLNCADFRMIHNFNGKLNGNFHMVQLLLAKGSKANAPFYKIGRDAVIKNLAIVVSIDPQDSSPVKSCFGIINDGIIYKVGIACFTGSNSSTEVATGFIHTNDFRGKIKDITFFQNIVSGTEAYGFSKYNYGMMDKIDIQEEIVTGRSITTGFTGFNYDIISNVSINSTLVATKVDDTCGVGGFSYINQGIVESVKFDSRIEIEMVNLRANSLNVAGFSTYNRGSVEDANINVDINISLDNEYDVIEQHGKFYGDDLIIPKSNHYTVNYEILKQ